MILYGISKTIKRRGSQIKIRHNNRDKSATPARYAILHKEVETSAAAEYFGAMTAECFEATVAECFEAERRNVSRQAEKRTEASRETHQGKRRNIPGQAANISTQ
jgi:hypothetical protein